MKSIVIQRTVSITLCAIVSFVCVHSAQASVVRKIKHIPKTTQQNNVSGTTVSEKNITGIGLDFMNYVSAQGGTYMPQLSSSEYTASVYRRAFFARQSSVTDLAKKSLELLDAPMPTSQAEAKNLLGQLGGKMYWYERRSRELKIASKNFTDELAKTSLTSEQKTQLLLAVDLMDMSDVNPSAKSILQSNVSLGYGLQYWYVSVSKQLQSSLYRNGSYIFADSSQSVIYRAESIKKNTAVIYIISS
jgi:hypothetical protein